MSDDVFSWDDEDDLPDVMPLAMSRAIAVTPLISKQFGEFAQALEYVADDKCKSVMATDCVSRIFYNAALIKAEPNKWTPALLANVIIHECMHIFRMDGELFDQTGIDHDLMNIATDACINTALIDEGYRFPGMNGATYQEHLQGKEGFIVAKGSHEVATEIYGWLKTQAKPKDLPQQPDSVDVEAYRKAKQEAGGAAAVKQQIAQRVQEAIAKAEQAIQDPGASNDDTSGPLTKEPSRGPGDHEAIPEIMVRLGVRAKAIVNPLMNVAGSRARGLMRSKRRTSLSISNPNPLSALYGCIKPGKKQGYNIIPAVAFDMSGSINIPMLQKFCAEGNQWVRAFVTRETKVQAAFFNTRVIKDGSLNLFRTGQNIPRPCGGTSFVDVCAWAEKKRVSHLLVWTDLEGRFPLAAPKGVEVIWMVPPYYMRHKVPFGKKVASP
jgi:predicted metal-dependent peptidase